jgi:hypothetical protein
MSKTKAATGTTKSVKAETTSAPSPFSRLLPYGVAILSFIVITFIFFSPMITDSKVIQQGDIVQFEGMAHEVKDFREKNHAEPLWTNSMFGGMPAFQISTAYKGNMMQYVNQLISLNFPEYSAYTFIACFSFFILLLVCRVNPWLAIVGGIAYGLSSYNLIIVEAGHNSKMHAISLAPFVFAGALLIWQRKYLLGTALSAAAFSLLIYANHVQIAYYSIISLIVFGVAQLVYTIVVEKDWKHFIISSLLLASTGLIGVASNLSMLWSTYEYGNATIRGKSELTSNKESNGGLDRDYAYKWSLGKLEAFTLMIPNFNGGSSQYELSESSALAEKMQASGVPQAQVEQYRRQMPTYWGDQPFTSGPVYLGAIMCFLFVLGLFIVEGPMRWWLGVATLLSVLLSFGHNLQWFSDLFFNFFPGYNKFRTVTMVLVIAQLTVPLLGVYALSKVLSEKIDKEKLINGLYISLGITAGLSLLIAILGPSLFSFTSAGDAELKGQFWEMALPALREDRASLMRGDAFRSFLLIALTGGLIWAYVQDKLSKNLVIGGVGVLVLFDMAGVGKRFINENVFVENNQMNARFQKSPADEQILADQSLNYRVYNTTVNSFNDASTSYHHKSIGGYHAAKLRRYQELIDAHIAKGNMGVFDMLNTKYFIVQGQGGAPMAQQNPGACGNAWFVPAHKVVANADEELKSLDKIDPRQMAYVDKRFADNLKGVQEGFDSSASIQLVAYQPNDLKYKTSNAKQSLAIFSEIYYSPGWVATIDGKEAPISRANYVLRALNVPAGAHEIEFKFQPKSYYTGETIAMASSSLILLLFAFALFMEFKNKKANTKDAA